MRRIFAVTGTAAFLVLAPGTVVGYVPWLISRWQAADLPGFTAMRLAGVALISAGAPVLLECFGRFALQGVGTPAPAFPTQRLVVKGFYRFVRNPMYLSVVTVLLGEALFFGSVGIALYTAAAWLTAHLFVIGYEEPTLRKAYGVEYETYCAHVPRWIPRLRQWSEIEYRGRKSRAEQAQQGPCPILAGAATGESGADEARHSTGVR